MRIVIAADHNGVALKDYLIKWLADQGHDLDDLGSHGDAVIDYPPLCAEVGRRVARGTADRGIVIGGSGSGEQIACNRDPDRGARAGRLLREERRGGAAHGVYEQPAIEVVVTPFA